MSTATAKHPLYDNGIDLSQLQGRCFLLDTNVLLHDATALEAVRLGSQDYVGKGTVDGPALARILAAREVTP